MSGTITCAIYSKTDFHNFFGIPYLWVIFLSLFVSSWGAVGQNPIYTHDAPSSRNLDFFTLNIADAFNPQAKLNRLIIAVDVNPEGERFVLTFGNGIKRVGDTDGLINFIPNQNDRLSNPLDFAINSEGKFFVATNESNRRFIRVYSPTGVYLPNETLGDGTYGNGSNQFRGPTGLAFDKDDNLYVADHYIGDQNPTRPSFIKIYGKDASGIYKNNLLKEFDNIQGTILNFPYRIAVNSQGHLYMAEVGQHNNVKVKILQFDAGFNPTQIEELSDITNQTGSAGSIIIDKFDNVFVADLGNDLDLSRILKATNDVNKFYEVFEIIKRGIPNNLFNIKVYNPNNSFNKMISSEIDLPVDLAISNCGTLYVNNTIFDGNIDRICIPFTNICERIPDITIDFDLEVYQRSPGYDKEKPILVVCPPDKTESLTNGKFILLDYREEGQFEDACDSELTLTQSPAPGVEISETTQIIITATDDDGNTSENCSFSVIIEEATENNPPIAEPDSYSVWEDNVLEVPVEDGVLQNDSDPEGDELIAVLDRTTLFGVLDLRPDGSFTYTPNLNFNGTDTFTYFANDGQGNSVSAGIVEITIKPVPDIDCETSFTLQLDANGEAFLLKEDLYDVDQGNVQFSLNKENFTCEDLGENIVILSYTYTIPDEGSFTDSCDIQIIVVDNIAPVFETCLGPQEEVLTNGEFILPDYRNQLTGSVSDNCTGGGITMTQDPAPQTSISSNTSVHIFAYDSTGNKSLSCSFEVRVSQPASPILVCPEDSELPELILDENCQYEEQNFTSLVTIQNSTNNTELTQIITRLNKILTVKNELREDGNIVDECTFFINLLDEIGPLIDCPTVNQMLTKNEEGNYIIPDYSSRVTDNCDANPVISQVPEPGSVITVDTSITLTAKDDSGNESLVCEFMLELQVTTPENQAPIANNDTYITDQDVTLNVSEGDGVLKNDTDAENDPLTATLVTTTTNGVLTLASNGSLTYVPNPGYFGQDSFTYFANDGELDSNIAMVTILVEAPNGQNPPVTQDDSYSIFMNETLDVTAPGILENDSFESVTTIRLLIDTGNGTLTLNNDGSFIYIPDSGFTGEDSFRYLILDGGLESSSATVTITVEPRPAQNEAPVATDDFYGIQQDGVLVVDAPGILANDTDANADVLTASVGSVTGSGSFEFNGNGSFKYTPLPGFTGTESFTYTANDGSLNSNVATVTITVNGSTASDFACKNEVTLQLDATGNISLQASDLYTGDPGDREFILSASSFDCTNTGENQVVLNYTGSDGSGSCNVNVRIEDNLSPEIRTQNINISLDSFGFASITPAMLDNGTSDNCGVPELSLDILDFSCKNLGENTVLFSAKDASGNSASQSVIVNITGNCEVPAIPVIKYIYIYPNPTRGAFTFETPAGWIIEKVDVFDYRGRYITTAAFPLGEPYNMDLTTLQTAVYTLHLSTNKGNKIIRVIIR